MARKPVIRSSPERAIALLGPGFYSYHTPESAEDQYRLHLRIEPDGESILIVNASAVLHLNQTGTEFAYHMMQGKDVGEIARLTAERYEAPLEVIEGDVQRFFDELTNFIRKADQEPVASFGFEPHLDDNNISAPYRLDCCLTYRMSENEPRVDEFSTAEWKSIIRKAFAVGIPHIVFFGGEPTVRVDLPALLGYVEELGLVSGLVTNGNALADQEYFHALLQSGLDHLDIEFDPQSEEQNRILDFILPEDIYTCVRLKIQPGLDYSSIIHDLMSQGANAFTLLPTSLETIPVYEHLVEHLAEDHVPVIGDMPGPLSQGFIEEPLELPGEPIIDWIYLTVLPDGEVWTRGNYPHHLGNLLNDEWEHIWENRARSEV